MTEQELLQALRQIVSEEVGKQLGPVKQEVSNVKQDLSEMRQDVSNVRQDLSQVQEETSNVKQGLSEMRQELSSTRALVAKIALKQENEVLPKLQLLYENQSQIIDEHKAMTNLERKVEVLEDEVFALKTAFKELKKA